MSIDIESLTIRELRQLETYFSKVSGVAAALPAFPFKTRDAVVIRTVTMIQVGKVREVGRDFIVLECGGWIADTGRFSTMLETGSINEFERVPSWFMVGRGAIVDAFPWAHPIPDKTK